MRNTHPNLYRTQMTLALLSIGLGFNFIILTPAFMPLTLPKEPIGLIFLGCGWPSLALLIFSPPGHMWLRVSMALSVAIYTFWAGALIYDFFDRSLTSLQLPLFTMGIAAIGFWWLIEPMINPATEKNENGK